MTYPLPNGAIHRPPADRSDNFSRVVAFVRSRQRLQPPPRCRPAASAANAAYQQRGAAASAECACSPGGSTTDGRETKHAGQSGCCLEVSSPQRFTDVVELAGIAERKI